jgi:hypothetical protein
MADAPLNIPVDAEGIAQLRQELKALADVDMSAATNKLKQYQEALKTAIQALEGLPKGTQAYKDQEAEVGKLTRAYGVAKDAIGSFAAIMFEARNETAMAKTQFESLDIVLGKMGASSHPLISSLKDMGKTIMGTGALALALGNDTVRGLIMPFSSADDVIKTLPRAFQNWNAVMRQSTEAINLVNMAFLSYGRSLEDARRPGSLLVDDVARISTQFGTSKKDTFDFIAGLKGVPGAYDAIGKSVATAGGPVAQFGQLMMIAKATGMDAKDVASLMTTAFERFGQKGAQAAAENIGMFHAAISGTDIPMSKAVSQIQAASDPLAIFGRKMTEATNLWKTFTMSLTDVPIDEVGKLVTTVSGQIANMNLNTQAFVAQMTGMAQGASALGGALRMELEMRQPGGMERNLERVTQAVSKLGGGRIINLQEAAQTPALEMQFQLQRQLVGQMLGIQGGQQQSRVLEVLQNVEKGGMTNVSAGKEVQNLMQTGQRAQNMNVTLLERIVQNTSRMTEVMKTMAAMEARPKAEMEQAGRAVGAAAAGNTMREADARAMGLHFARAGQQLVSAIQPSMTKLFDTLTRHIGGVVAGVEDQRKEQLNRARRSVTDDTTIEVDKPSQDPMRAMPLPMGAGFNAPRVGTQKAGVLPIVYRRPDLEPPTQNPNVGGVESRTGRRTVTGKPTTEAETERYKMEPLVPETITVKVVCEQCNHKLAQKMEHLSHESRGD